ncbi:MAG: MFS transporter [Pedosphaera sp.]|nr:MFS transporter [Pedosphaera sp.]
MKNSTSPAMPWWRHLNRYHWFVLMVAALGWLFDCLDQQLFNLARVPAMKTLLVGADGKVPDPKLVAEFGGYATSIFLIGWATGGLTFGILGDRIGRAKTMMITILIYSLCTGLSALSQGFWDFAFYRFITGLGVGGEFAVGVALVAEVMPDIARPYALGLLQALSAVGNVTAALVSMFLGHLEESGAIAHAWKWMFLIGAFPALLALLVRARLKEPERWRALKAAGKISASAGSYAALFGNPNWKPPAGIAIGAVASILLIAFAAPSTFPKLAVNLGLALLAVAAGLVMMLAGGGDTRWRRNSLVGVLLACAGVIGLWGIGFFSIDLQRSVLQKTFQAQGFAGKELAGKLTYWSGITSIVLNSGAFCGMLVFSMVTQRIGRRPALAAAFVLALISTAATFWGYRSINDLWLIFVMGFCQLSLFAGYAIYFPELFPTHLRSTGTSFCYNVGRFAAASGPALLGLLTSRIFTVERGYPEGMRNAGLAMCAIFLLGLFVLPFAPETKGQPLPEEDQGFAH